MGLFIAISRDTRWVCTACGGADTSPSQTNKSLQLYQSKFNPITKLNQLSLVLVKIILSGLSPFSLLLHFRLVFCVSAVDDVIFLISLQFNVIQLCSDRRPLKGVLRCDSCRWVHVLKRISSLKVLFALQICNLFCLV